MLYFIRGVHINHAIKLMEENFHTKGAPIVASVLKSCMYNGLRKGFQVEQMYVKEAFVGKRLGHPKLDIKARAKRGIIHSVISSLTIWCEQKPMKDMIKDMLRGKADRGMGTDLRMKLFREDANYEDLQRYGHLITS